MELTPDRVAFLDQLQAQGSTEFRDRPARCPLWPVPSRCRTFAFVEYPETVLRGFSSELYFPRKTNDQAAKSSRQVTSWRNSSRSAHRPTTARISARRISRCKALRLSACDGRRSSSSHGARLRSTNSTSARDQAHTSTTLNKLRFTAHAPMLA